MKNKDWFIHATRTVNSIKEFRQQSCLGMYTSPKEYLDILEEYIKVFYDINNVPERTVSFLEYTKKSFDEFNAGVGNLCDLLLERIEEVRNDNDTPKDKEASESA